WRGNGVTNVAIRQTREAACQGNYPAVGYHFENKVDLIGASVRRHTESIERRRLEMVERAASSPHPRDWILCLIRPLADHLDSLGNPTSFARSSAQAMTGPPSRVFLSERAPASALLR